MKHDKLLDSLNMKIDLVIDRQAQIKEQVEKTNGRVTLLEKFMWTASGGIAIFGSIDNTSIGSYQSSGGRKWIGKR